MVVLGDMSMKVLTRVESSRLVGLLGKYTFFPRLLLSLIRDQRPLRVPVDGNREAVADAFDDGRKELV